MGNLRGAQQDEKMEKGADVKVVVEWMTELGGMFTGVVEKVSIRRLDQNVSWVLFSRE